MRALITGITGQDGAYLSEHLLSLGYEVHGIKRRSSSFNTSRVDHLYTHPRFHLHYGDLSDSLNIVSLIKDINPDEVYNLAAMSHVHVSFDMPEYTANVDALGTLRVLEAVRSLGSRAKIYQASSSELYGKVHETPQTETTPFHPRSPYAVAKLYAYWATVNYREAYNMFACNGILFNHESPLRGETFVTRKITMAVARIALRRQTELVVGNLDAKRDWGHAKDYVKAMHLMLQHYKPDDYVIATGVVTSVREFIIKAFKVVDCRITFTGHGVDEVGMIAGRVVVRVDPKYYRPAEVDILQGDYSKAKRVLGWEPTYTIDKLIEEMVEHDKNI